MLQARNIMHPRLSVMANEKGEELVRKLLCGYSALPVINEQCEVLGVVSEQDILSALKEGRTIHEFEAQTVMSSPAITVNPDTSVDRIMEIMLSNHMTMLPVVENGNSQLLGIIGRKNILNAAAEPGFWPEHEFKVRVKKSPHE